MQTNMENLQPNENSVDNKYLEEEIDQYLLNLNKKVIEKYKETDSYKKLQDTLKTYNIVFDFDSFIINNIVELQVILELMLNDKVLIEDRIENVNKVLELYRIMKESESIELILSNQTVKTLTASIIASIEKNAYIEEKSKVIGRITDNITDNIIKIVDNHMNLILTNINENMVTSDIINYINDIESEILSSKYINDLLLQVSKQTQPTTDTIIETKKQSNTTSKLILALKIFICIVIYYICYTKLTPIISFILHKAVKVNLQNSITVNEGYISVLLSKISEIFSFLVILALEIIVLTFYGSISVTRKMNNTVEGK